MSFIDSAIKAILTSVSNDQADQLEYDALSDNVAEVARAKAYSRMQEVDALQRGEAQAGRVRLQAGQLEGQQRVAYALSGVDASSGSAASTINSSRLFSELDAAMLRNNAAREALGHKRAQDVLALKSTELKREYWSNHEKRRFEKIGAVANYEADFLSSVFGGS